MFGTTNYPRGYVTIYYIKVSSFILYEFEINLIIIFGWKVLLRLTCKHSLIFYFKRAKKQRKFQKVINFYKCALNIKKSGIFQILSIRTGGFVQVSNQG